MGEIKALTSMRGLFALWVLSYHLVVLSEPHHVNPGGFFGKGYLGVDFFFLLSGFVLAGAYGRKFGVWPSGRRYLGFLISRFGRIYPLNVAVTAACVFVAWLVRHPFPPWQVIAEAALVHRWPFVPAIYEAINGPAWSISCEILANIGLPLFVLILLASPATVASIFGLSALLGIAVLGYDNHGSLDLSVANSLNPTIRSFCEFAAGMLIFRWRKMTFDSDWIVAGLAIAATVSVLADFPDPITVVLMVLIILTVAGNSHAVATYLGLRPLHFLGELSFSIYLIQLPLILAVQHFISSSVLVATIVLPGTLALSLLTYRFIEMPARIRSKRFAARIRTSKRSSSSVSDRRGSLSPDSE
jgi:peptidoglycan/LPS O-acetylase OafA/YrhL